MRKIINSTYISLDGVVEEPHHWPTVERPADERRDQVQLDLLTSCDVVLMGRRTYDVFAPAWQARSGDPFADRMNAMSKYVVSTTLENPDWTNTTVISGDVAGQVREMKSRPGKDIVQYGFGAVSSLLMEHGLLDELRLWIHPLFVGAGNVDDLLFGKAPTTQFELIDATILNDGVAVLAYRLL
jgi:dihydrofolate reductase